MRSFSERHGLISPKTAIQRGRIDERLRNRLWSLCDEVFWNNFSNFMGDDDFTDFALRLIQDQFFGSRVDELKYSIRNNIAAFREWFLSARWNEVYDLVQFIANFSRLAGAGEPYSRLRLHGEKFTSECNSLLQTEKSAYRFVGQDLCEITDEGEILEIEKALTAPQRFSASKTHLSTALGLFADREKPDYRNSIKEAISAIESAFSTINGKRLNSLSDSVKMAEKKGFVLHPALKSGILSIYGWTSDEGGVRHALFDADSDVGEAQAKLMLVMCSALLNYLISQDHSR